LDIGFIGHLYTPLGATRNYSAIGNLQTLHITTSLPKLFQPSVSSAAVPWQRLLAVEILQLPAVRPFFRGLFVQKYLPAIPSIEVDRRLFSASLAELN
jgi:hypothetical protein